MRRLTVARSFARDMAAYLDAHGVDSAGVAREAALDLTLDEGRVSGAQMAAFWGAAVRASRDPDLGLHTATASGAGALDIVGYVMLTSASAADALRRGARLMRLLNDGVELHLAPTATGTLVTLVPRGDARDPLWSEARQVTETIMAGLVHQCRVLTGRDLRPASVRFTHAAPSHGTREHERIFGLRPVFEAAACAVELSRADLEVPLRSANPALLSAFTAHADAALSSLGIDDRVGARVASEIVARLKGEAPSITVIARVLAMSTRSLQRALTDEGTSYQQLLDDVRRELALRHLAAPGATVAKVAWLLGFSEPSAFYRAQRRWDGRR